MQFLLPTLLHVRVIALKQHAKEDIHHHPGRFLTRVYILFDPFTSTRGVASAHPGSRCIVTPSWTSPLSIVTARNEAVYFLRNDILWWDCFATTPHSMPSLLAMTCGFEYSPLSWTPPDRLPECKRRIPCLKNVPNTQTKNVPYHLRRCFVNTQQDVPCFNERSPIESSPLSFVIVSVNEEFPSLRMCVA